MLFSVLCSGSKQNCFYIATKNTAILIDIGLRYNMLKNFLTNIGANINSIKAVFITHAHNDHIRGVKVFAKKHKKTPIYLSEYAKNYKSLDRENFFAIYEGNEIIIDDLKICPFKVNHDIDGSFGFNIYSSEGKKLFLASDLGSFDEKLIKLAKNSDSIAIESNYDLIGLDNCSYPLELKDRIKSNNGHLSNEQAASFLEYTITEKTKNVFFLHISEDSNSPDIINNIITKRLKKRFPHINYHITNKYYPLPAIHL